MSYLQYDQSNFILGINRIDDGIGSLNTDTQEIIAILKAAQQVNGTRMRELTRAVQKAGYSSARAQSGPAARIAPIPIRRTSQPAGEPSSNNRYRPPSSTRRTNNADSNTGSGNIRRISDPADRSNSPNSQNRASDRSSDRSSDTQNGGNRQRDANGRFTGGNDSGGGSSGNSRSGSNMPNFGASDSLNNIDPIIESYKELRDVLSPLGKGAKFLFNGAKMGAGKIKALKRREPLPIDQDRHNNENEKLLDKIWKAILNSDGGGGGRGLLGGLLGGGGRGGRGGRGGGLRNLAGRGLRAVGGVKGLGAITALAGGASLAMDWDSLDHKGKSEGVGALAGGGAGALAGGATGAAIGSVVPVVGTIAGGLVGAAIGGWIGSDAGEVIGGAASPYIQSWTQSMTAYNLPSKVEDIWSEGISPFFSKMDSAASSLLETLGERYRTLKDRIADKFGFGGGGGGGGGNNGVPADQAAGAADFAIKNAASISLGACAKYVNDAFRANGLKASGHGKDVAANLQALNKGKFESVAYDENYKPQVGDVMSMPSSKNSKHGYGHAAVYTNQGWVSDYKQGEKYGNTAAPNADYYEDIQSGRIKPTIVRQINEQQRSSGKALSSPAKKQKIDQAMRYFTSQGWTPQQAAGIVGNLQKESQFDHKAVGDSGRAQGIAQWHPDRQANFQKKYGKSIKNSTYEEQLAFVNHELTKGTEQRAGKLLKGAKTAGEAGSIVSQYYERPANTTKEKIERAAIASDILKQHGASGGSVAKASKPTPKQAALSRSNAAVSSKIMPATSITGTMATTLPSIKPVMLPKAPQISSRLDSGDKKKPMMLQASNENIPQNVSDRALAHAITGGLGEGLRWG